MARTIKRVYARYTQSFKAEAVRLASQPGILVQDVAQSLDIHPFMLSRWKKKNQGVSQLDLCHSQFPGSQLKDITLSV